MIGPTTTTSMAMATALATGSDKLLTDSDDTVSIELLPNQARFAFGQSVIVSKVVDGKFPDYERVIPKDHPKEIMLQRSTFLPALQRSAILTNEKFKGVRVVLSAGTLKLISSNAEQEEAQEELEIDYNGDALDTGEFAGAVQLLGDRPHPVHRRSRAEPRGARHRAARDPRRRRCRRRSSPCPRRRGGR